MARRELHRRLQRMGPLLRAESPVGSGVEGVESGLRLAGPFQLPRAALRPWSWAEARASLLEQQSRRVPGGRWFLRGAPAGRLESLDPNAKPEEGWTPGRNAGGAGAPVLGSSVPLGRSHAAGVRLLGFRPAGHVRPRDLFAPRRPRSVPGLSPESTFGRSAKGRPHLLREARIAHGARCHCSGEGPLRPRTRRRQGQQSR